MKDGEFITNQGNGIRLSYNSKIGRSAQDIGSCGYLKDVFDNKAAREFLKSNYKEISRQTKPLESGSCGISAIISSDGFLNVANVGDSMAALYIYDEVGQYGKFFQINHLHSPDLEKERLKSCGAIIGNQYGIWRLDDGHGLAMSRAFGDKSYQGIGLISETDYYSIDLKKFQLGCKMVLVVCSDGALDYPDPKYPEYIISPKAVFYEHSKKIRQALQRDGSNIASSINSGVLNDFQRDDLTTYCAEINTSDLHLDRGAMILNVFDGHGESEIVAQIANTIVRQHMSSLSIPSKQDNEIAAQSSLLLNISSVVSKVPRLIISMASAALFGEPENGADLKMGMWRGDINSILHKPDDGPQR